MSRIPCPRDCPKRAVGCRTGCPEWQAHEKAKAERYRLKEMEAAGYRPARKPPRHQAKKATTGGSHRQSGRGRGR